MPNTSGSSWSSDGQSPGEKWVTYGAYRAVIRKDTVELALDVPAQPIPWAFRFQNTWYFVTVGGDIFSARTFLGSLTDTGLAIGKGIPLVAVAGERVLLSDNDHALWSFNGTKLSRINPPAPGVVTRLWYGANGRPLVGICGRDFLVQPDGSFEPARLPDAEPLPSGPDAATDPTSDALWMTRVQAAIRVREWDQTAGIKLHELVALRSGAVVPRSRLVPPGREHCDVLTAGVEPLIFCPPKGDPHPDVLDEDWDAPPGTIFRLTAAGRAEPWLDVPITLPPETGPGPSLLARDHFSYIWFRDGKRDEISSSALSLLCEPGAELILHGLAGKWVLLACHQMEKVSFLLADLSSVDEFEQLKTRRAADLVPNGARVDDAGLSADQSTLWILFRDPKGQAAVALGAVDARPSIMLVPAHTRAVAFVNRSRGVAIGRHLGEAWSTLDGAAHWSRLTFPEIQGDPAAVPLRYELTCSLLGCSTIGFTWADPRALKEVGYRPRQFIAPAHVPSDRAPEPPILPWYRDTRDTNVDPCAKSD